jgi:hypothetical protein
MDIRTHNGTITVKNTKTGNHRTFRIKSVKGMEGKRVVSLLIGPDNTSDYLPIGFATESGVRIWRKYTASVYEKTLEVLNHIDRLPVEVFFESCCRRCNRALTTPESVQSGIGPECAKKGA